MSPEKQFIAIAEACGWTAYHNTWKSPSESKYARIVDRGGAIELIPDCAILPDYLNDLNAMHEAENTLTDEQHRFFRAYLYGAELNDRRRVSATARQRAEAFLKTIGKWEDE